MRGAHLHDGGAEAESAERPKVRRCGMVDTRDGRKAIKKTALSILLRHRFDGRRFRRKELAIALGLTRQQVWNLEQEILETARRVAADVD